MCNWNWDIFTFHFLRILNYLYALYNFCYTYQHKDMKNNHTHLSDRILSYVLVPTIIVLIFISYFRFVVYRDYIVEYERECNPATEDCFIGCEDDACTEEYYYSLMTKYASDLYSECGADITDCEEAQICLPDDRECSITYCDTDVDGDACEAHTQESVQQIDEQIDSTQENILQNDNIDNI
jgi:hypothetical protein